MAGVIGRCPSDGQIPEMGHFSLGFGTTAVPPASFRIPGHLECARLLFADGSRHTSRLAQIQVRSFLE
jgi:hypothetical protein